MRTGIGLLAVVACAATVAPLQGQVRWQRGDQDWCDQGSGGRDRERFCEVLTTTLDPMGSLDLDGGANGGVRVEAWDRNEIEVRARVQASARSEDRAQEIGRAVELRVDGGRIRAEGPGTGRREGWGVSWEVHVPRSTNLRVRTTNGGIDVTDVVGDIDFRATNGGVTLVGVAGDVRGRTTNGGLHVELSGDGWSGAGMDVETTNGGVTLLDPRGLLRGAGHGHHERGDRRGLPGHGAGAHRQAAPHHARGRRSHDPRGDDQRGGAHLPPLTLTARAFSRGAPPGRGRPPPRARAAPLRAPG